MMKCFSIKRLFYQSCHYTFKKKKKHTNAEFKHSHKSTCFSQQDMERKRRTYEKLNNSPYLY